MSNNFKKSIIQNKKYIYFILIFFFLIIFIVNLVSSFFQNKVLSILSSSRFENYLLLRVENYLEKLGDGELTEKEIEYYSSILNRINQKFKPVFDKLEK